MILAWWIPKKNTSRSGYVQISNLDRPVLVLCFHDVTTCTDLDAGLGHNLFEVFFGVQGEIVILNACSVPETLDMRVVSGLVHLLNTFEGICLIDQNNSRACSPIVSSDSISSPQDTNHPITFPLSRFCTESLILDFHPTTNRL